MAIVSLNNEEKKHVLDQFYKSFENGYEFEKFLKPFLEKLGLSEVVVTKASGDGGIDLEAIRPSLINDDVDSVIYKIQAKRYKPGSPIGIEIIQRHLGIINSDEVGIIITTGRFTKEAELAAKSKLGYKLILIDGEELIDLCIEKNIGFVYEPKFSLNELKSFYKEKNSSIDIVRTNNDEIILSVDKEISVNDIRATILRIPRIVLEKFSCDKDFFDLTFNGEILKNVPISKDRKYFSKEMSRLYKKYNLKTNEGLYNPTKCTWNLDKDNNIHIKLI